MRRSALWVQVIVVLGAGVWLARPLGMAAASSGKIIYSFAGGNDGAYPYSDLIVDSAGNLYGTTYSGGTDSGTVFELMRTNNGWKHEVLYSFAGSPNDGAVPLEGLVFDNSGNLYGTTAFGGSNCSGAGGCGTVFKLTSNSHGGWSESVIFNFTGTTSDGQFPNADLVIDGQGNLYGTAGGGTGTGFCGGPSWRSWNTPPGCGIVFKLTRGVGGAWKETTLYDFGGAPDAAFPIGALVLNTDGSLYGATEFGGVGPCIIGNGEFNPPDGCGTIYKLSPSGGTWTETIIHSFLRGGRARAKRPAGGLILESSSRLLGTSSQGGDGVGTVFQLEQTGEPSVLHRFYTDPDGWLPVGRLAKGTNGTWVGTTERGGSSGNGTVFEVERTQQGWKERVLFSFSEFADLRSGPVVDSQGHVYGTLLETGIGQFGAVYEVIP
jgi:uncharacterized repeat protein (TIGR03803 family)